MEVAGVRPDWPDQNRPRKKEVNKVVKIVGELEIDCERGVIYFHSIETGATVLRICQLPVPIPASGKFPYFLDVTHMSGTSWDLIRRTIKSDRRLI